MNATHKSPEQWLEEATPAKAKGCLQIISRLRTGCWQNVRHGGRGDSSPQPRRRRVVDRKLESYMEREQIEQRAPVTERFAGCIGSNPAAQYLIARVARMAERIGGELYVVYVDIGADERPENKRSISENVRFAENVGAQVIRTKLTKVAHAVADLVREKHITQVVFGRSAVQGWRKFLYLSAIHSFLRDAPPVDVHIVTQETR
jgi:two-component system, OmpR family, sensor histidine kinase KdpD